MGIRKDWSDSRRYEEVDRVSARIEKLESLLEHLLSEDWRKPLKRDNDD